MDAPQPASTTARFLDESVLPIFTQLRMTAFGRTVIDIAADQAFDQWSFSDKILYALDKEVAARHERRVNKLLKASRSPNPDACIEDIVYTPGRNINKEQITRLAQCQWCQDSKNVVILGKSSVGKTYLAQALLNAACRKDYSAKFFRTDSLANQLAVLHHSDPERVKFLEAIHNTDVLVLDDFLTTPINEATAHQLLTIIAERENRGATIVTSQFAPIEWCKSIPDAVIAESILNRLAVGAEIITLEGDNMRLTH